MNILLCTLGASWAVVPESYALASTRFDLFAHHPNRDAIERLRTEHHLVEPDELWVCTTEGKATETSLHDLLKWWELMRRPMALRVWSATNTDQLASQSECERFRELAFRLTLKASESLAGGQLLLSLAGGRKTMSADLQRAASLFGAHRLIHVVDSGHLPPSLYRPSPEDLTRAIAPGFIQDEHGNPHVMPLIVGRGQRNEILDICLDGQPAVHAVQFPLPLAEPGRPMSWLAGNSGRLVDIVEERERQGASLMGNYLASIDQADHHENWRHLYRLPSAIIESLRSTPLEQHHSAWLQTLPKADLHRHLGGCLDLPAQIEVARAVWSAMHAEQRTQALVSVQHLLDLDEWPWDWPNSLKPESGDAIQRSYRAAALLLQANNAQLVHNLWQKTEPRIALNSRHEHGFAAYERPGELTGSAILQHEAAIAPYARAIVKQARAEGLAYLELRGSPQKYLNGDGQRFLRLFAAALNSELASVGERERPEIRFVVIVDRRGDETSICQSVQLAVDQHDLGFVVGLDLAGDEHRDPAEMEQWFTPAFKACLPITIHAGEGQPPEKIWRAAYHLHADRIGHGLTLLDSPRLIQKFRDRGICLELCPTSNREVVGFNDPFSENEDALPTYPLLELWQSGLMLTICTDNPGISRTNLTQEYLTAARMSRKHFTLWDTLAMIKQSFAHAFLPSDQRARLIKQVDQTIYQQLVSNT